MPAYIRKRQLLLKVHKGLVMLVCLSASTHCSTKSTAGLCSGSAAR